LVVLTINGKEIEVDPLTAEKIYEALEVRINNKVEAYIDEMTSDNIVEAYERRLEMKREESRI
jgi:2-oxo-4-hydroxy-4-carboxy--5-ureidoimidazoline (OHCU) decarboxylase